MQGKGIGVNRRGGIGLLLYLELKSKGSISQGHKEREREAVEPQASPLHGRVKEERGREGKRGDGSEKCFSHLEYCQKTSTQPNKPCPSVTTARQSALPLRLHALAVSQMAHYSLCSASTDKQDGAGG